jgi:SPW repeat
MLRLARNYAAQARTASGVNVALGIWLIVSPWVFDYSRTSAVLSSGGRPDAFLAAIRVASSHNSAALSGLNLLLGFWALVSPWACEYTTNEGALLDNIVVGVLVAAPRTLSRATRLTSGSRPKPTTGGWMAGVELPD